MTISGIQPLLDRPVSNVVTIYRRSSRSGPDATDRAKGEALNRNLYDEFVQKHLEQRSACTCHLEHTSVVLIECSSNEDLSIYSKAKYLREVLDPYGKTDGLVVLYRGIDGLSTNSRGVQKLFGSLDLGTAVYMHQHGHGFVKQDFGVAARLSRDAGLSVNTGLEVAANKNDVTRALRKNRLLVGQRNKDVLSRQDDERREEWVKCAECGANLSKNSVHDHDRRHKRTIDIDDQLRDNGARGEPKRKKSAIAQLERMLASKI